MPSTASRLSAERQSSTSVVVRVSAICLTVNCRNLSCVSSITLMASENSIMAAVSSQKRSSFLAPTAS